VTQTGAGDFRISLLLIRDHNFNFILMAALIALGCEFILLGEFWHELLWTGNQLHCASGAFRTFAVCFNHGISLQEPKWWSYLLLVSSLCIDTADRQRSTATTTAAVFPRLVLVIFTDAAVPAIPGERIAFQLGFADYALV
jgi:hypothetical protein